VLRGNAGIMRRLRRWAARARGELARARQGRALAECEELRAAAAKQPPLKRYSYVRTKPA
jgi:hypothetical protein